MSDSQMNYSIDLIYIINSKRLACTTNQIFILPQILLFLTQNNVWIASRTVSMTIHYWIRLLNVIKYSLKAFLCRSRCWIVNIDYTLLYSVHTQTYINQLTAQISYGLSSEPREWIHVDCVQYFCVIWKVTHAWS